ncbi:hypothetical protein FB45DRAFT_859256 [Roridomyces roridus]|uniref:Uncharacterized protein n=1 Tax=Roridomyces roridus TaxID=1738132 RepID=A0AAD7CJE5_9AGAR|nr:hypothetical protein FB45DRAFT_859256 [Roridomyces roridus]
MFVQARHSLLFPSKLEIAQQSYRCPPTGNAPTLKAVSCRAFLYSTPVSPVKISVTVRSEMAPSLRQRRGHAFISPRTTIERLEYLVVGPVFTRDVVGTIHDCIVTVGEQRFLVSAHYDDWAPVNPALKRLLKGYNWRGELVIAALGRRDPLGFVEVTRFNQSEIKRVLNRFLTTALTNIHEGVDIPAAHIITTGFSILYRFGDAKSRCSQWLYRGVLAVKELVAAADSSRRTMETLVLAGKSSWRPNSETSTLNATGVALIVRSGAQLMNLIWTGLDPAFDPVAVQRRFSRFSTNSVNLQGLKVFGKPKWTWKRSLGDEPRNHSSKILESFPTRVTVRDRAAEEMLMASPVVRISGEPRCLPQFPIIIIQLFISTGSDLPSSARPFSAGTPYRYLLQFASHADVPDSFGEECLSVVPAHCDYWGKYHSSRHTYLQLGGYHFVPMFVL